MTTNGSQPQRNPLSIMPAEDGWRAIYVRYAEVAEGAAVDQERETVPLVGWGVFAHGDERGNFISGVVADRTYPHWVRYLICAEAPAASELTFFGYLAPGMPEPSDDDARTLQGASTA